ncbi:MAG: Transaldolase [uncultured Acidimicrobiales bacterium]|uniref:Transaldolase n=1 Tax=uncultured Acidimicrobiales bacterium TaxID=310071 RepID=A0A6J4H5R2_9ACTN|nr:MAG: Transaldolase [uncultured Acidimicrobiales bacterium]
MTRLERLFHEQGQSPWLDNLKRGYITSGDLARLIDEGIRGITSNPTIFQKAIAGQAEYDDQFRGLMERKQSVDDAYWDLVIDDVQHALDLLRPLYVESGGGDGFVSIEVAPGLANDTEGTIASARQLDDRIEQPNLLVKIPATAAGIPAIRQMIAEGRSINITLIFSLERYAEVIEAYFSGLEDCEGDLGRVHSVASFFVSRVDTEVDRRLQKIGTDEALALRGKAAVAQAKLAYELFTSRFRGERWEALSDQGARVQRPLWASTSTKNPAYPDTLYVDSLIGPDTINTMPDATIDAFERRGTLACTINKNLDQAHQVMDDLARIGVDMADVGRVLEEEGVASFAKSFDELMGALNDKAAELLESS